MRRSAIVLSVLIVATGAGVGAYLALESNPDSRRGVHRDLGPVVLEGTLAALPDGTIPAEVEVLLFPPTPTDLKVGETVSMNPVTSGRTDWRGRFVLRTDLTNLLREVGKDNGGWLNFKVMAGLPVGERTANFYLIFSAKFVKGIWRSQISPPGRSPATYRVDGSGNPVLLPQIA